MHYVSADRLTMSYGIKPLFHDISFNIEEGDKIALVARNGTGKSTLLKILAGKKTPDSGNLWIHNDVTVALFEQEPSFAEDQSILDNIFHHSHPVIDAIREYEDAIDAVNEDELGKAIVKMDEQGAWNFDNKVHQI